MEIAVIFRRIGWTLCAGGAWFKKYGPDSLYFGVFTATFYLAWILSSYFGAYIGDQIDPLKFGLDLAFPVTFTALLIPSLKGKSVIATAVTAAVIVISLESLWPGNDLKIVITGIVAPLAGLHAARRMQHD